MLAVQIAELAEWLDSRSSFNNSLISVAFCKTLLHWRKEAASIDFCQPTLQKIFPLLSIFSLAQPFLLQLSSGWDASCAHWLCGTPCDSYLMLRGTSADYEWLDSLRPDCCCVSHTSRVSSGITHKNKQKLRTTCCVTHWPVTVCNVSWRIHDDLAESWRCF